jgi:nucleoside-diphosphate-sugar epimerase
VQREILRNDAFDRLRAELGKDGFEEMAARRVRTIAGDVGTDGLGLDGDDRATLASCDLVIHSAATVAFDSPLDSAVEVNLLGPTRIVTLLGELGVAPHLVAVSTCYVAGNRRGRAPEELVAEGPFAIGLSWKAEVAAARRLRSDAEPRAGGLRCGPLPARGPQRNLGAASPRWRPRPSSGASGG